MRRRATLTSAIILLTSLAGAQGAPPDPARIQAAAEAFDEGARAFKAKEYDAASLAFEAADRAAPSPAALANAIRARKLAKQTARAATIAAAAIARYPKDKEIVDLAEPLLLAADKALHRVTVSCQPECSLVIDGKVATSDRIPVFVSYLDPGSHTVVAGWTGDRSKTATVKATAGGIESLDLVAPEPPKVAPAPSATAASITSATRGETPPPAVSAPKETPPPPKASSGLPPWVVFLGGGATVVLGGVSAWSGIDTQKNPGPDAVRAACAGEPDDCKLYQQGLAKERRTNILFGATAGAAVLTGVVAIFFTDWSGGKQSAAAGARSVPRFASRFATRFAPTLAVGPSFGAGAGSPRGAAGSPKPDVSIGMEGVF